MTAIAAPREIASGLKFPEGPIALDDGSVILVEIARGTLSRVRADGRVQVLARLGGGPNGAAMGPDGAIYVCNNGGFAWRKRKGLLAPGHVPDDYSGGRIERVDLSTGKVERLYEACDGEALRGPNDLVFDAQGGFWFTDHGKSTAAHRDWGALYYAKADGSRITRVRGPIMAPNGVGLSPDEQTVYYAETLSGRLLAADIVPASGKTPASLGPLRLAGSGPGLSYFDSLAVQADGAVCVATLFNAGVSVIKPGGKVRFVSLPGDPYVTNLCFGGKALKTAFVTLSGTGRLVALEWPARGLPLNFLNK
ncbi:MAG TPA: gluconolaconase [Alphaproteobacteria bacterium]|nr:gluconolaconase [Alphaproteobacteria bacterium]HAJ48434.1 gluconolaconase [Alphaproteobacteria bacterium]